MSYEKHVQVPQLDLNLSISTMMDNPTYSHKLAHSTHSLPTIIDASSAREAYRRRVRSSRTRLRERRRLSTQGARARSIARASELRRARAAGRSRRLDPVAACAQGPLLRTPGTTGSCSRRTCRCECCCYTRCCRLCTTCCCCCSCRRVQRAATSTTTATASASS